MNNAFLEEELETKVNSSTEKARLTRLLEVIDNLLKVGEWHDLAELHFVKEEERIERLLLAESKRESIDLPTIYRLQGELRWAKRYVDLRVWAKSINKQLSILNNHE